eukprot:m.61952 g.61952  ORF g.61952 m.61952 type:complete len:587 (+) comp13910_c0_seq1:178-1938(+)
MGGCASKSRLTEAQREAQAAQIRLQASLTVIDADGKVIPEPSSLQARSSTVTEVPLFRQAANNPVLPSNTRTQARHPSLPAQASRPTPQLQPSLAASTSRALPAPPMTTASPPKLPSNPHVVDFGLGPSMDSSLPLPSTSRTTSTGSGYVNTTMAEDGRRSPSQTHTGLTRTGSYMNAKFVGDGDPASGASPYANTGWLLEEALVNDSRESTLSRTDDGGLSGTSEPSTLERGSFLFDSIVGGDSPTATGRGLSSLSATVTTVTQPYVEMDNPADATAAAPRSAAYEEIDEELPDSEYTQQDWAPPVRHPYDQVDMMGGATPTEVVPVVFETPTEVTAITQTEEYDEPETILSPVHPIEEYDQPNGPEVSVRSPRRNLTSISEDSPTPTPVSPLSVSSSSNPGPPSAPSTNTSQGHVDRASSYSRLNHQLPLQAQARSGSMAIATKNSQIASSKRAQSVSEGTRRNRYNQLENRSLWLHDSISRKASEQVLTKAGLSDGLFLIRLSTTHANSYVLCLAAQGRITHHLLKQSSPTSPFTIDDKPFDTTTRGMTTLEEVVMLLRQRPRGFIRCRLVQPCPPTPDSREC